MTLPGCYPRSGLDSLHMNLHTEVSFVYSTNIGSMGANHQRLVTFTSAAIKRKQTGGRAQSERENEVETNGAKEWKRNTDREHERCWSEIHRVDDAKREN